MMEENETETSQDYFADLMDNAADKMGHARQVALDLLEMANDHELRAEKLRHLAALMILEAQSYSDETANLLTMEFPMKNVEEEESE